MTLEERNAKLDEAKALILKGWCQGSMSTDANGNHDISPSAVNFCALGACWRVTDGAGGAVIPLTSALSGALERLGYGSSVTYFNDMPNQSQYSVAAIFDHAKEQPL